MKLSFVHILLFIMFYFICKKQHFKEKFTTTEEADIQALIDASYDGSIEAIKNLGNIAKQILNNNELVIPGNLRVEGKVQIGDGTPEQTTELGRVDNNLNTSGNLVVDGLIKAGSDILGNTIVGNNIRAIDKLTIKKSSGNTFEFQSTGGNEGDKIEAYGSPNWVNTQNFNGPSGIIANKAKIGNLDIRTNRIGIDGIGDLAFGGNGSSDTYLRYLGYNDTTYANYAPAGIASKYFFDA